MKISVVMATYNGEKYITEQMDSIREQSYPVDDVIIHDDCSQDNTVELIRNYIEANELSETWVVRENEKNVGYASNFVHTLTEASGDLIFFSDQDDIWMNDRIARMAEIMKSNSKIQLLGSEFIPFSSSSDAPSVPKWELAKFRNDESIEQLSFSPVNIFIGCQGCTMCVRKTFLEEIKAYWFEGWAHDEYVWKLSLCTDGLFFYHSPTLKRRLHSGNVTLHKEHQAVKRLAYLEALLKSHIATLRFATDHLLEEKKMKLLKKNIRATELRIEMIRNRKWYLVFVLMICYRECYHKKRAIPVELCMAVRGH